MSLLDLFFRKPKPQTEPMCSVITMQVIIALDRPVPKSALEPWRKEMVGAVQQAARELRVLDPRLSGQGGVGVLLTVGSSVREE